MMVLGKQIVLDLYGCPADLLSDPRSVEAVLLDAADAMRATIVTSTFHHFSPLGVSGVVVIQESHLAIHTWPEHGYCAVDIFTCGDIDLQAGVALVAKRFQAQRQELRELLRGDTHAG